jgi:hypothetical protein
MLRLGYVNALYWLGSDRLWKDVERRVAPDGRPRSICIGSDRRIGVQVMFHGEPHLETMFGYRGCLRTFVTRPHGRGRPWATWCLRCRDRKSNAREAAVRDLQRRIAEIGRGTRRKRTSS